MRLLTCSRSIRVPRDIPHQSYPIAALIPWSLTPGERKLQLLKSISTLLPRETPKPVAMYGDSARWTRSILTKSRYQMALRVLQFPREVHKFVVDNAEGKFNAWWTGPNPVEGDGSEGLETRLLFHVMRHCYAEYVGRHDAKVVFIHVGALKHISKLPDLARRRKRPDVSFYLYGTHNSVHPLRWGVRAIYPIGTYYRTLFVVMLLISV